MLTQMALFHSFLFLSSIRWWWWFSHSVASNSHDPMDYIWPGSCVHGILQARTLEWVAIKWGTYILCPLFWVVSFCVEFGISVSPNICPCVAMPRSPHSPAAHGHRLTVSSLGGRKRGSVERANLILRTRVGDWARCCGVPWEWPSTQNLGRDEVRAK